MLWYFQQQEEQVFNQHVGVVIGLLGHALAKERHLSQHSSAVLRAHAHHLRLLQAKTLPADPNPIAC